MAYFNTDQQMTARTLTLSGGSLRGTGVVGIDETVLWTAAYMEDAGRTIARSGVVISGTVGMRKSRVLDNLQTPTWRAGNIHISDGAQLNNPSGALFEALADGTFVIRASIGDSVMG